MAISYKQTESKSTEESNLKMRRSFSWDRAFFTCEGLIAAEELSSMIEGGRNEFNHELQKIEELESMESKMFQEIEASTQKSTVTNSSINSSSGKRDSQAIKEIEARGPHKDAPIKTPPTRSSPLSGGSPANNVKTLSKRSTSSKNGKANADSPSKTPPAITTKSKLGSLNTRASKTSPASPVSPESSGSKHHSPLKTPPGIITKNKVASVNTRVLRTSPASPVSLGSSGSSSSACSVNQWSKLSGNGRRNDDWKSSKPAVDLMPKSQSTISLKIKPPPVISRPSSPSEVFNYSDQRSKSNGIKGSSVHHTTKQPATTYRTGSNNDSNARKIPSIKTAAAANTGIKPKSPKKTTPKKQLRGAESIVVISPEILDLKGKINALKMEISLHKDRCNRMVRV